MTQLGKFWTPVLIGLLTLMVILIHICFSVSSNLDLLLLGISFYILFYIRATFVGLKGRQVLNALFWLLVFLAFFTIDVVYYVSSTFTGKGITQQVLDHLSANSLRSGLNEWLDYYYGLVMLPMVFLFAWLTNRFVIQTTGANRPVRTASLLLIAFLLHPASYDIAKLGWYKFYYQGIDKDLGRQYRKGQLSDQKLAELKSLLEKKPRKNVVIIYLEGYERAALDASQFPNLANNFRAFEQEGSTYGYFSQALGASHTIAGIVSSQCGVPYATTGGSGNSTSDGGGNYYMPHIQCLADVTAKLGYMNVYYQGGSLDFTRKRAFFKAHGYAEVKGIMEPWDNVPAERRRGWGLHDDVMLGFAAQRIDELMSSPSNQPFMFTTLTLDTHDAAADRRMSVSCQDLKKNLYVDRREHVIQDQLLCSDTLVANFVNKIRSKYPNQIDIYLVSDHLPHAISTIPSLRKKVDRELIFIGLNQSKTKKTRVFTHMDIAATILDEITEGGIEQFGMGVSMHSQKPTLIERFGLQGLNQKIHGSLQDLANLYWEYPTLDGTEISADLDTRQVQIDTHTFPLPALFELDNDHKILNFFSNDIGQTLKSSGVSENVLYIDSCADIADYQTHSEPPDALCLMAGKLGAIDLLVKTLTNKQKTVFDTLKPAFNKQSSRENYAKRLFEQQDYPNQKVASAPSTAISPLLETAFSVGRDPEELMVTNYRNPSAFEQFKGFKNHLKQDSDGPHLFAIDAGAANLIMTWDNCDDGPQNLDTLMQEKAVSEFVLLTGDEGWNCETQQLFSGPSGFDATLNEVAKSDRFVIHLNRDTNTVNAVVSDEQQDLKLRLINHAHYGNPKVHSFE